LSERSDKTQSHAVALLQALAPKSRAPSVLILLVVLLVGGGTVVGFVIPTLRGQLGGLSSGSTATYAPGTQSIGDLAVQGSIGFGVSGGGTTTSGPSTTVVGTVTMTQTEVSTGSSTSAVVNEAASPANGTGSGGSGRDIEFFSNLTLNVTQPQAALQKAGEIASSMGGYVAYSTFSESTATVTLRVPGPDYQSALAQLEALGAVISASSSSNDVAVQYADLNATLQSLLTEQTSLLKLLSGSSSVNATLSIESVLQKTDAQINSVESSILQTGQLIDYATISIVFQSLAAHPSLPLGVKLSATPLRGMSPLSVTFNAVVKGGVQPYIVNFNFGDGTAAQGQQLIHLFAQAGTYNVTVSATDQSGNVSLSWILVDVTAPPAASGLGAFGGYVWSLFAGVVEGIVEVAAVALPIFAVFYVGVLPVYRRASRPRGERRQTKEESAAP
jgi:hypothetical protein